MVSTVINPEARIDFNRRSRIGMVEAIWGEHKTSAQIANILVDFQKSDERALVTRVSVEKANEVLRIVGRLEGKLEND